MGLKAYKSIFIEPNIEFYGSLLFAFINSKKNTADSSASADGIQVDATLGAEWKFTGLESLGFTFEIGLSFNNKTDSYHFETAGQAFGVGAIHFYL